MLLNEHIDSQWQRSAQPPYAIEWELAIRLYNDNFALTGDHQPVALTVNKVIGFMLAYCDRDKGSGREHFIGSHAIQPQEGNKNLGYIDASVFDQLILRKAPSTDKVANADNQQTGAK